MMCSLFHCGLRATDAATTLNFYTRVLGMLKDESRPDIPTAGFWLRAALPGSPPSIHVFTRDEASAGPAAQEVPVGSGAIDHLSLHCKDYRAVRQKLAQYGVPWEGGATPGGKQWIIFVHDPNGVMLEMSFDAAVEGGEMGDLPPENTYRVGAPFRPFEAARYAMFAQEQA